MHKNNVTPIPMDGYDTVTVFMPQGIGSEPPSKIIVFIAASSRIPASCPNSDYAPAAKVRSGGSHRRDQELDSMAAKGSQL